jgi:hypothetical protein
MSEAQSAQQTYEGKITKRPDTLIVENLDQFIAITSEWHANKCKAAQHLLNMPEGAEMVIGEEIDGQYLVLEGKVLEAFKLGVNMVLMELGTLPFGIEYEPETSSEAPEPEAANDAKG